MKFKLILSLGAFLLTFIVSINSNILFTSIKRGIFALVIFYILASILEKILEREMKLFTETNNKIVKEDNNQELGKQERGSQQNSDSEIDEKDGKLGLKEEKIENGKEDLEFQTLDYDKIDSIKTKSGDIDVDNMDPETIAKILRNLEDDDK
ncbi:hypothetical protein [Desulfuribacillus alkaliarsenatis]|uniref:Uncharacterized protein n=1 Tax=Desulfuribacillus alkaliarsenatis TaxID=766136 RepID=A0A1E5G607_9FIRM|nr:hypothetical protein [Desulfuribacillus alkaliarsenatis]OEF98628.1 hypothetical protein BHF68_02900 [Desulfuribacillus alkaliarsenatis]